MSGARYCMALTITCDMNVIPQLPASAMEYVSMCSTLPAGSRYRVFNGAVNTSHSSRLSLRRSATHTAGVGPAARKTAGPASARKAKAPSSGGASSDEWWC
jgi:hypothetical protein